MLTHDRMQLCVHEDVRGIKEQYTKNKDENKVHVKI